MDSNGSAPAPRRRAVRTPAAPAATGQVPADAEASPASTPAKPRVRSPKGRFVAGSINARGVVPSQPALAQTARMPTPATTAPAAEVAPGERESGPETEVRERISMPEATLASLELHRGAIGRLDAQEVDVHFGAIGAARADEIAIELGSIGAALTNELAVTQGAIGTVLASEVHLDQTMVRTMVARSVVVERPSLIGFLLARRVSGDVRVLFDWRGAVVFGVLFGLIARVGRRRR